MTLEVDAKYHTLTTRLSAVINSQDLVLFLKGAPSFPLCGFSGVVCHLFKQYKLDVMHINVLRDPDLYHLLRQLNFPEPFPHLYVRGHFFGGYERIVNAVSGQAMVDQDTFLKNIPTPSVF